jgi:hypothetical protein
MVGALLSACSESTMIRSYPPNAKLYVNGTLMGLTPIVYTAKHSRISDVYQVRLEREGYQPLEDVLHTRICPGRIVGGIFTLGIVLLVRGPTCFASPQEFTLQPSPAGTAEGVAPPTIEERLQRIERMRDQGTINQQEFEEYRKEILKGL